jgi:hypothetical protein
MARIRLPGKVEFEYVEEETKEERNLNTLRHVVRIGTGEKEGGRDESKSITKKRRREKRTSVSIELGIKE